MLNGEESLVIKTSLSQPEFFKIVEDVLQAVGSTTVDSRGKIAINASRFSNAFVDASLEGNIRNRADGYTVNVSYRIGFPLLVWLIAICFGITLVGFAAFIPGFMAKSDIATRLQRAVGEIRDSSS